MIRGINPGRERIPSPGTSRPVGACHPGQGDSRHVEADFSGPNAGDPVRVKDGIGTHERDGFDEALSHEKPVKRITMMGL